MTKKRLFLAGAHRGGRAVTNETLRLLPAPEAYGEVIVADPKENRAVELARVWKEHGIRAKGEKEPAEKAIEKADADRLLLAVDIIIPMAKILEKSPLPAQWQLLCRGLGENGPVIGLSGTIHEGDSEERTASMKLIEELGAFIAPQSSSKIRQNPLNADFLHVMRKRVSEHSAKRIEVLERDPKDLPGGQMNLFWGPTYYPLMVQKKTDNVRWRELKEQVLEAELPPYLKNAPAYAVAVTGARTADFFVIDSPGVRRSIRFHMPLISALPRPRDRKADARGATGAGLFASLLAAAVVTD